MLHLILTVAAAPGAHSTPIAPPSSIAAPRDDAYDRRLADAGADPAKLWDLVIWCEDTDREKEARSVLRRIIRADPDHTKARDKLGHIRHDKQWFTTQKKLDTYKAKERDRIAKEQGLVKYEGDWVHPDDLPFLERGLVRTPDGQWMTPDDLKKLEAGWERQDLVWVAPDEMKNVDAGLWKCGEDWLSPEDADRYHARLGRPWVIPSDHLTLHTNCSRDTATKAIEQMERAFSDLVRVFGKAPGKSVPVFLAKNAVDLGSLCTEGNAGAKPIETRGLIESLKTVFAESWYDPSIDTWLGMGASWWDAGEEHGDQFGVHYARMALGLSFVDAVDPSPKAVANLMKKKGSYVGFAKSFYDEKEFPPWFRWGAASYASRFYLDQVKTGGDPEWVRKWSVDNLRRRGGLPSDLSTIFEMELAGGARDAQMTLAAGLVVAFVMDGECPPVREAHAEFKAALRSDKDPGKILEKLRKQIEKHETDLRAFSGL